jgi:arylformamidase
MSQNPEFRAAIAAMGYELNPGMLPAVYALLRNEQEELARSSPSPVADLAYGKHPRQRLDIYAPLDSGGPAPVLVWVHGGGFLKGEKSSPQHPFNAHAGRFAARNGFLGVVINYRLAPESVWPSGAEDLAAVVDWLKANAAGHGGDPERIVLAGTSAGAVHVAGYLRHRAGAEGIRGAVMLSGLYGFTGLDDRDCLYYGDHELYADRHPREAVVATELPLLLACAEFDPPRFQAETLGLLQARLARHGQIPRAWIATGHNHFSMGYHLGGSDTRLSDEIVAFVRECAAD